MPPQDPTIPTRASPMQRAAISTESAAPSSPVSARTTTQSNEPAHACNDNAAAEKTPPCNARIAALATKRSSLESTLSDLQAQRTALAMQAKNLPDSGMPADWSEEQTQRALAAASRTIKEHIALLHKYNEIKDIGQGLMGMIAAQRGVRVVDVMEDFGIGEKD